MKAAGLATSIASTALGQPLQAPRSDACANTGVAFLRDQAGFVETEVDGAAATGVSKNEMKCQGAREPIQSGGESESWSSDSPCNRAVGTRNVKAQEPAPRLQERKAE